MLFRRLMTCALPVAASLLAQQPAHAVDADPFLKSFPRMALGYSEHAGQRAVDRLGGNLEAVARWYGRSATQLQRELLRDKRLRVDQTGRLFVIEEIDRPLSAGPAGSGARSIADGKLAPLAETFNLHSKPDSQRTLVLNFRGATLENTGWNRGVASIKAIPYDTDGKPATFSDAELTAIQYIWQRVAEDFAPFDINVTTELVAADRLTRSSSADQVYGGSVLITNNEGVYACSCGGVAYVRGFGNPGYNTGLAFNNKLSNNEKYIAEAVSHEAGHLLGLLHDGTSTAAYYGGQGMWAPIMGVGYSRPLVQWSKGEYANASNKEDDLAVMQQFIALRADDAGNTPQTAAVLQPTVTNGVAAAAAEGLIGRPGDRDVYMFTARTGSMTATVSPAARSPNADLTLSLLNDAGVVLASGNPLNALNASVTFTIPRSGTYYLQVGATGQGIPSTDGYSDYGSLGNYRLTASYTAAGGSAPTAALTVTPASGPAPLTVQMDSRTSRDDGEVRFVYWNFGNGTTNDSGTLRATSRTYAQPGTYAVSIRVVDDTGLSSTATQTVTVTPAASAQRGVTARVNLSPLAIRGANWAAQGTLFVTDDAGARLANASVSYSWSGLAQGARTATSQAQGTPILSLASSGRGCFVLTVTAVTLSGYTYSPPAPVTAQACR